VLSNSEIVPLLNNTLVVIKGDTISLKQLVDISREQQITLEVLQENYDSLSLGYNKSRQIIDTLKIAAKNLIQRDSLLNENSILYKQIASEWESKYNKLTKPNKLNGIIGGTIGATYNLKNKQIISPTIAINLGLMFKRKYITQIGAGISTDGNITFSLGGSLVF